VQPSPYPVRWDAVSREQVIELKEIVGPQLAWENCSLWKPAHIWHQKCCGCGRGVRGKEIRGGQVEASCSAPVLDLTGARLLWGRVPSGDHVICSHGVPPMKPFKSHGPDAAMTRRYRPLGRCLGHIFPLQSLRETGRSVGLCALRGSPLRSIPQVSLPSSLHGGCVQWEALAG